MTINKLEPVDLKQCQAEKPAGNFMRFGFPKPIRCPNKPTWIAVEKTLNDGMHGSWALCDGCHKIVERLKPNFATFQALR